MPHSQLNSFSDIGKYTWHLSDEIRHVQDDRAVDYLPTFKIKSKDFPWEAVQSTA